MQPNLRYVAVTAALMGCGVNDTQPGSTTGSDDPSASEGEVNAVIESAPSGVQCVRLAFQAADNSIVAKVLEMNGLNACALDTTGQMYCWGSNDNGQIGDRTIANALVATPVMF